MLAKNFTNTVIKQVFYSKTNIARNFSVTPVFGDSIKIQNVKDFNDKVINSKVPVVVDFFAEWCNPCRLLAPRIESIISENKGKVLLAKVDIDEQTDLALDYEVSSVPVLIAIKNGKIQQRLVGLHDADKLRKWIDQFTAEEDKAEVKA